jgi:coatomer subunit beta
MHGLKADFEKPVQLTGLSDPIFAEALITIEQFDLTLLILVVNQTRDTLHNLCLELFTVGALKVSERPEQYTLAPEGFITIKVGIKLSSSDGGLIFGLLAYDVRWLACVSFLPFCKLIEFLSPCASGTTTTSCVVLSDISVDAIDYIQPSTCTDEEFRRMWADFEWENKLTVKTGFLIAHEWRCLLKGLTLLFFTRYYVSRGVCQPYCFVHQHELFNFKGFTKRCIFETG